MLIAQFNNDRYEKMNVGILLFDEVEVLDFAGPYEVFAITIDHDHKKIFNVFTVAQKHEISARNGLVVKSDYLLEQAPQIDILVIPGGYGAETVELYNTQLLDWIKEKHQTTQITFSICTGAFILAESGLLNGLNATTHWMDLSRLDAQYPQITVIKGVKFVDEHKIITAAGISSGINASLHIVSKLTHRKIALNTARRMEFEADV
jgi:transcriptional regulator GlxA family with amidase domain